MTLRIISCPQYDRTKGSNDKEEAELNTAWENQLLNGRDERFEPKSQTEMFLQSGLLELSVGYGSKVVNSAAWLEFLPISDTPVCSPSTRVYSANRTFNSQCGHVVICNSLILSLLSFAAAGRLRWPFCERLTPHLPGSKLVARQKGKA